MRFETYAYETMICVDCSMAVANADFTGMDAATEKRVIDGLEAMAEKGENVYLGNTDEMVEFYVPRFGCGVCGTRLAGTFCPATVEKG